MTIPTPDPATTDNKLADDAGEAISVLDNAGVKAVEALLIVDVPWLSWPIIKSLWQIPFAWIATYFTKAAQNGATFLIVDVQVDKEETNLSKALQALVAAEKAGDAAALKKAIQAYADAQSSLIRDDGSSPATG